MTFDAPTVEKIRIAIAYHSGYGHTARQAEAVAQGARSVPATEVRLWDIGAPTDELWQGLASADAIIFGAPTYMGGPSAQFKMFADASAKPWYRLEWKDKLAAGFTNSGQMSGDKLNTLVYMATLAAQHGMHWVNLGPTAAPDGVNRLGAWLGAMAQSDHDLGPDMAPPESDLRTAAALGERVARTAREWVLGRALAAGREREPIEVVS